MVGLLDAYFIIEFYFSCFFYSSFFCVSSGFSFGVVENMDVHCITYRDDIVEIGMFICQQGRIRCYSFFSNG